MDIIIFDKNEDFRYALVEALRLEHQHAHYVKTIQEVIHHTTSCVVFFNVFTTTDHEIKAFKEHHILMVGFISNHIALEKAEENGINHTIRMPFNIDDLYKMIAEIKNNENCY